MSKSTCPAAKCGDLLIGNTSTTSCGVSSCAYAGYTNNNANNFTILTNLTTPTTCNSKYLYSNTSRHSSSTH
ncbi:hypothetical protein DsansV1_C15g0136561 [Dioscorea sansibarensis]